VSLLDGGRDLAVGKLRRGRRLGLHRHAGLRFLVIVALYQKYGFTKFDPTSIDHNT